MARDYMKMDIDDLIRAVISKGNKTPLVVKRRPRKKRRLGKKRNVRR